MPARPLSDETLHLIGKREYVNRSKVFSHFILQELLAHSYVEEWFGSVKRRYKITDKGKEYLNTFNMDRV